MVGVYIVALNHELVDVRVHHDMFENKMVINHKIVYTRISIILISTFLVPLINRV